MAALKPRPPFQVLVMSAADRLGRNGCALKQLSQAGVRCYSYLDEKEFTLDTALDEFMMSAATFAADMEREKARQRVGATMGGRRAPGKSAVAAVSATTTS